MLESYKHVIWDWNGTLLNDVDLSVNIMNGMLRERTMPEIDSVKYQQIFEFPVQNYYRKLGFDFSVEPFESLAAQYFDHYNSRIGECELHDGVADLIQRLKDMRISQSVLSSLKQSSLNREIYQHKLSDYFNLIRGLDDHHAAGKTEVGRNLIRDLGIEPSEAVLIGDTSHDLEVANYLNVDCILISIGHYSIKRLDAIHDSVVGSIQSLVPTCLHV